MAARWWPLPRDGERTERVPLPQILRNRRAALQELIVHRLMHDEALRRDAVLAARLERSTQRGRHDLRDPGVPTHHKRVLPAQLQRHRRERVGCVAHDGAADAGAADEDDLLNTPAHERAAGVCASCTTHGRHA